MEISLDGTLHSNLDWKQQQALAESADHILWNIDLGLFSKLPQPLNSIAQYNSLKLSLEHFCNTLWKQYREKTIGICLYKGTMDFSLNFPWDEEQEKNLGEWLKRGFEDVSVFSKEMGIEVSDFHQINAEMLRGTQVLKLFCRDVAGEYLDLLSGYLPEGLDSYVSLDTTGLSDPLLIAQLTTKERYPHLKMIIDGKMEDEASVAVCLPAMDLIRPSVYSEFPKIFERLRQEKTPYRVIPEAFLTSEWHGLDVLYVSKRTLSPLGARKLQGFQATGGTVIDFTEGFHELHPIQ